MVDLVVTDDAVTVEPTTAERIFGIKGPVEIPLAAVQAVTTVDDPMSCTRGGRFGTHVPAVSKIGTWGLGTSVRQLVFAYRGRPGLRIELDRSMADYDDVIVSIDDADAIMADIRRRSGR